MSENKLKTKVLSNLIWRYAERCGAQGVQFIVSIILARLLSPSDYGLIGLITVFISVCNLFISSGFGNALVQKKNAESKDFSSVFYFNIVVSVLLYIVMFFTAPLIADFYNEQLLIPVIRVLSLGLVVGGFGAVQNAYVQKGLQFKKFFFATLGGTIVSAVVGIYIAYKGGGVWALVAQTLTSQCANTLILWIIVKWRPTLEFSFKRMKVMFSFGWKMLASSIIDTIYNNIYTLVIGKFYSTEELGIYNRGKTFPVMVVENINSSIQSVLFPAMSKYQDNRETVKNMVRRSITVSTFLIFPAMAGLAAIAKPLTVILLTEKWLPSVPFMWFCCFTYAFWPIHTANLQAINALGRSDIFLKLEIIKKVLGIATLIATIPFGLYTMMWGRCITTLLSSFINAYPNKKLLGYSYIEQVKDMLPSFILSIVMLVIVYAVEFLNLNNWLTLIIQIILGMVIYFGLAKLFKLECFNYILNTVTGIYKAKRNK